MLCKSISTVSYDDHMRYRFTLFKEIVYKNHSYLISADKWLILPSLDRVTNQWKNSISLRKSV
jgi:hypothetical protein